MNRLLSIAPLALIGVAQAQTPSLAPTAELAPADLSGAEGFSIDLDGDRAAIGAPDQFGPGLQIDVPGRVNIWERNAAGQWSIAATIEAPAGAGGLANDLALDGDRLLVGATGAFPPSGTPLDEGAVLLYERTPGFGWTLVDTWFADFPSLPGFGRAMDLDGDRAIVGNPQEYVPMEPADGAVYIRERQADGSWPVVFKHISSAPPAQELGADVVIDGDVAAATNPTDSTVTVFERDGLGAWSVVATLFPLLDDGFTLALEGSRLVVSSQDDNPAFFGGRVTVYERSGSGQWAQTAVLDGADEKFLEATDVFGTDAELVQGELFIHGTRVEGDVFSFEGRAPRTWRYLQDGLGDWILTATYDAPLEPAMIRGGRFAVDGTTILSAPRPTEAGYPVLEFRTSDLLANSGTISLASGGAQVMELYPGFAAAGRPYLLLGSFSGTAPGVDLGGGLTLPLAIDPWFQFVLTNPNSAIANNFGVLDGHGRATATLSVPAGLDPALAGSVLNHAFTTFDPVAEIFATASQPLPLTLAP